MRPKPSLILRVRSRGWKSPTLDPYVQIEIWDKGPALSEEKIKEISLIGDSTKAEGMGLGLSIIRTLVQAHSGEIRFSKSEQGGLKVTILLPLITSKNNQQEEQNAQNNN